MKIAILLPTLGNSGGVNVICKFALKLTSLGYDVDIIRPIIIPNVKGWRFRKPKEFIKMLVWLPLNLINFNLKKYFNSNIGFKSVLTLRNIPKSYDIYIATWWETAYYLNKLQTNKRKLYFIQGYEVWNGNEDLVKETYTYVNFELITISNYLKKIIQCYTNKNIHIIYNEIENNFKINWNLKENKSVGIIYRSHKLKGFDNFINYLNLYKSKDLKYYCVGRNIPKKYINNFDFIFDGSDFSQMNEFYNKIEMLVIPSESEGFALPVIEAMSCGVIVSMKQIGISEDLLVHGENSITLEDNKPIDIKTSIDYYNSLSNEEVTKMSKKAYLDVGFKYYEKVKESEKVLYELFEFVKYN